MERELFNLAKKNDWLTLSNKEIRKTGSCEKPHDYRSAKY